MLLLTLEDTITVWSDRRSTPGTRCIGRDLDTVHTDLNKKPQMNISATNADAQNVQAPKPRSIGASSWNVVPSWGSECSST